MPVDGGARRRRASRRRRCTKKLAGARPARRRDRRRRRLTASSPTARPKSLFHAGAKPASRSRAACRQRSTRRIAKLPIPKVMSYAGAGGYYNDEKFVRPAHRLLALHGADVVPVTRARPRPPAARPAGHRFLVARRHRRSRPPTPTRRRSKPKARSSPSFAARRARDRRRRSKAPPATRRRSCPTRCSTR